MDKNKESNGVVEVILFIIIVVALVVEIGIAVRDNSQAKYLNEVCTETTYGSYYGMEHSRVTSNHLVVSYVIDNTKYKSKGMYKNVDVNEPIEVHYNPSNVSESYCGKGPVRTGLMEAIMLVLLASCVVIGLRKVFLK